MSLMGTLSWPKACLLLPLMSLVMTIGILRGSRGSSRSRILHVLHGLLVVVFQLAEALLSRLSCYIRMQKLDLLQVSGPDVLLASRGWQVQLFEQCLNDG